MPLSYRVVVQAGDQKINFGTFIHASTLLGTVQGSTEQQARIKSLPRNLTRIDVLFTPDPKAAEAFPVIEQIWGQPYQIKDVPLQRFDLATTKPAAP
jgi:hypothetical protein